MCFGVFLCGRGAAIVLPLPLVSSRWPVVRSGVFCFLLDVLKMEGIVELGGGGVSGTLFCCCCCSYLLTGKLTFSHQQNNN